MAPHSSTLAWKTPWTEEPGGLQSMGSPRVGRTRLIDFTFTFHSHALEKEMATHSSVLAWRILGMGEPRGLPPMGLNRVGHNWSDLAAVAAAEWILLHLMSPLSKFPSADPLILLAGYKSSAVFAVTTLWKLITAKSLQLCPTLCDPRDGSPTGSPVPGILQARTLEWVAISLSNAWKWKVKVKSLSRVRLLAILWTAAHQAPPSMGFSRQEYRSGVPLPSILLN